MGLYYRCTALRNLYVFSIVDRMDDFQRETERERERVPDIGISIHAWTTCV